MKLVIHIGHGKTGSSSIQRSLLAATAKIEAQGIKYLGLMLENASTGRHNDWQVNTGSDLFFEKVPLEVASENLFALLDTELKTLIDKGYKKAIWSNEWILERPGKIIPAIKRLNIPNLEIEFQAYIRRHDKWALSAYTQWGLRHKIYPGPIMGFEDWVKHYGISITHFYPVLRPWIDNFPNKVRLMNFDAAKDVVQHFLAVNSIYGVPTKRDNIAPPDSVIISQALFNSRSKDPIFPVAFEEALESVESWNENQPEFATFEQLMPTQDVLQSLVRDRADDIHHVNALLVQSGEPPLSFDTPIRQPKNPSSWDMDQLMLKLIFSLIEQVNDVKSEVKLLQNQLASQMTNKVS